MLETKRNWEGWKRNENFLFMIFWAYKRSMQSRKSSTGGKQKMKRVVERRSESTIKSAE